MVHLVHARAQWTSARFTAPTVTNNYTDASSQGWGLNSGWLVFYNRTASTGVVLNSSAINVLSQQVKLDRCVGTWAALGARWRKARS